MTTYLNNAPSAPDIAALAGKMTEAADGDDQKAADACATQLREAVETFILTERKRLADHLLAKRLRGAA